MKTRTTPTHGGTMNFTHDAAERLGDLPDREALTIGALEDFRRLSDEVGVDEMPRIYAEMTGAFANSDPIGLAMFTRRQRANLEVGNV